MKWIWERIKLGIVPLFIITIPFYVGYWIWKWIAAWQLHFLNNEILDVPISIIIVLSAAFLSGCIRKQEKFNVFLKEYSLKIPIIGWIFLLLLTNEELRLVEVRTTWGPTPQDGNWEYALETRNSWEEDGHRWHRVHTLCMAGKLFARIGENNIRSINRPARDIWVTIFSMGLR